MGRFFLGGGGMCWFSKKKKKKANYTLSIYATCKGKVIRNNWELVEKN